MPYHHSLDHLVETIQQGQARGKGCGLLVGAGCSVTAGIPSAQGFVEIIKERFPQKFGLAEEKTYPRCMAELTPDERRALIAEHVDKAKINWAHICIALLIKHGYVRRVLTTNFDPLVMRACALLNEFPAVYDFAASQLYKPAFIPDKAVYHLHGQRTGFILINTNEDFEKYFKLLKPVFRDTFSRGDLIWIVVGYSGENDPVFKHLSGVKEFDNSLWWVGYQDREAAPHLKERLLQPKKHAYYLNGFDADSFFITLTQKLAIFPPDLIQRPFSHLHQTLGMLTPFSIPGQEAQKDVTHQTRQWIQQAIGQYEGAVTVEEAGHKVSHISARAQELLMAGDYEGVIALEPQYESSPSPELADTLAWAYIMSGNILSAQAKGKRGAEAKRLYKLAAKKYAEALKIKPDKHEALYNWGLALHTQAKGKRGAEADQLYNLAGEKYAGALKIKPDVHETLYNWGTALCAQAEGKSGAEADRLYRLAGEKYAEALKIKPDKHECLNNWGNAISAQAKGKSGVESDRLYKLAEEKYAGALKIKPDKHESLYNWGNALSAQAKGKSGAEADRLYKLAGEKYAGALKIKPEVHEALNNWGNALLAQAKGKSGAEADRLYKLAGEKYAGALKIKPDMHEALNNWGNALLAQAKGKSGAEANRLYKLAGEKYAGALKIKPDKHEPLDNWGSALLAQAKGKSGAEADRLYTMGWEKVMAAEKIKPGSGAYNLACISALRGDEQGCQEWLKKSRQYGTLPSVDHIQGDADLDSFREKDWFKQFLSQVTPSN